jgi:decaprenyl-phosphate phosphoribosyltransferase
VSTARAILITLRPAQWVKNLFVAAPLVFSKHLFDTDYALRALWAVAAFCALSGAVYLLNDLRDAPEDRMHPLKKHRPIAAGTLSESAAVASALVLAGAGLLGCVLLDWRVGVLGGTYLVKQVGYSFGLKRVAFLDVLLIAAGFLLRVSAGAYAIAVDISPWLLACTGLLAGMLGFGKRAHELLLAGADQRDPTATRPSLAGYDLRVLRVVMILLAAASAAGYALYTQDARTLHFFGTRQLIWTLPMALFGIFRFLQLALWRPRQHSPTDAVLRDWPSLLNLAVWAAAVVLIIYGAR